MIYSFVSLLGKEVKSVDKNKKIGVLCDVLIAKNGCSLFGIIASNDAIIYRNRLFLKDELCGADGRCVYVRGTGKRFAKALPELDDGVKSCKEDLRKNKVITDNGTILGKARDASFDFETGKLLELEVGSGFTDDILSGRKKLLPKGDVTIFANTVIVKEEDFALLDKNAGLKRFFKME